MIVDSPRATPQEIERGTGWAIKPEGACKDDRCVPLPDATSDSIDLTTFAERLRMPLVHDAEHDLWCLGPEFDAPPLSSARAPNFTLPDWKGNEFSLDSLRGQKVLLLAWASW